MSDAGKGSVGPQKLLVYLALFFAVFYLWLFLVHKETVGYYFPYTDDLTIYEQSEETFNFKAGCRDWGRTQLYRANRAGDGYACGWDCEFSQEDDLYICDSYTPVYTQ